MIKAPFRYATFAVEYLRTAQKYTKQPLKQTIIAPSTLSLVYKESSIENYSREQFLDDLINEAEKDIRQCLQENVDKVQLDFPEAKLALKWDQTGRLLQELIQINNRLLDRFNDNDKKKLGVHICSGLYSIFFLINLMINLFIIGNDKGSTYSSDVDYSQVLREVFQLHLKHFYLQLASEEDPDSILLLVSKLIQPEHRVFIGVIDPLNHEIEKIEDIRDRVLRAAKYIPINQLGTTDDCGFAPFNDNDTITREKCYEKIRARIEGTKLAEEILNQPL